MGGSAVPRLSAVAYSELSFSRGHGEDPPANFPGASAAPKAYPWHLWAWEKSSGDAFGHQLVIAGSIPAMPEIKSIARH